MLFSFNGPRTEKVSALKLKGLRLYHVFHIDLTYSNELVLDSCPVRVPFSSLLQTCYIELKTERSLYFVPKW